MTMYAILATDYTGGGTGALDAEDGASFTAGDFALVAKAGQAPEWYEFISTTDAENSPYLIRPDTNGTGVAWRQCSLISGNATLYATTSGNDTTGNGTSSAPWATLGKAISWLNDKQIESGITVTVSLGSGTFVESAVITIRGEVFKHVGIQGNGSANTTISNVAAGVGCLYLADGTFLKDIRNIKLLGDNTSGTGISVQQKSGIYIGADLIVNDYSSGITLTNDSLLVANSGALTSSSNVNAGLYVTGGSEVRVQSCVFNNNGTDGLFCYENSVALATGATASNNTNYGFRAIFNSFIKADSTTATGNGVADYSPAKTTAADPTFANNGSWIYG